MNKVIYQQSRLIRPDRFGELTIISPYIACVPALAPTEYNDTADAAR